MARKGFASYRALTQAVAASGNESEILGTTWSGHELRAIRAGGTRLPAILIVAGSHGAEFVGVNAAVELTRRLKTDHVVYVIPCRDPVGFDGMQAAVSAAVKREVVVDDHAALSRLARRDGRVHFEDEAFLIATIGDVAIASDEPSESDRKLVAGKGVGYERVLERLVLLLADNSTVRDALRGRRILIPGNFFFDGTGPFENVHTVIQRDSRWSVFRGLKDLATLFNYPAPPLEVAAVKTFTERVQPGLLFDFHGGYGSDFYTWTSFIYPQDDFRRRIALSMTSAVEDAGYPIASEATLESEARGFKERNDHVGPGVAMKKNAARAETFINFFENYGPSFQLEPPIAARYEDAVEMFCIGVQAAVDSYADASG